MKPTFKLFWHLTVTVVVGLTCFAAGRTSGIHDCQKDYLLRAFMHEQFHIENNQRLIEQGIQEQQGTQK